MEIDLNCDLGEGAGSDVALMPLITSANIACAFHAGDPIEMMKAVALAKQSQVTIGAHPGHRDPEHFGRRELSIDPSQVHAETVYQIGALSALARFHQAEVKYVKPHGGLYHQANRDDAYADAIVEAARLFGLVVMGLPHSRLEARAKGRVSFVVEGFADRRYRSDGSLLPRDQPDAFIDDPVEAIVQTERLIREQGIRTICVHGDNAKGIHFVQALRDALLGKGFTIRAFA